MMSSKDLYLAEHERLTAEAEDAGMDWATAYESTADAAWDAAREKAAELADNARQRMREGL